MGLEVVVGDRNGAQLTRVGCVGAVSRAERRRGDDAVHLDERGEATGRIGGEVLQHLAGLDARLRALRAIATRPLGTKPLPNSATESPSCRLVSGPATSVGGGGNGAFGSNVSAAPAASEKSVILAAPMRHVPGAAAQSTSPLGVCRMRRAVNGTLNAPEASVLANPVWRCRSRRRHPTRCSCTRPSRRRRSA